MKLTSTNLPGVTIIEPRVFGDDRGWFMETWHARGFAEAGLDIAFVQDNHSRSERGVLRGLHYQLSQPQGKLVRAIAGRVFDVAVDMRRTSANFGQWTGVELSAENHRMLWIPPGFAHGFLTLSDAAEIAYKCDAFYAPADERVLLWNDVDVAIVWPLDPGSTPKLSARDAAGVPFSGASSFP